MSFDKLSFKKIGPSNDKSPEALDRKITELQDNIQEAFGAVKQVSLSEINRGVIVEISGLPPLTTRTYEHNLNREPKGWIVVDLILNTTAYPVRVSWNKKYIEIQNVDAGNAMDVKLLVF